MKSTDAFDHCFLVKV